MSERTIPLGNKRSVSFAVAQAVSAVALGTADLATLAIVMAVAVGVRISILPAISHAFDRPTYPLTHYAGLWWIGVAYLAALAHAGLYTRRDPYWEEVRRCVIGTTVGTLLVFAVLSAAKIGDDVSRPVVVLAWALLLVALPMSRRAVKEALFAAGPWRRRAVLIGSGPLADALRQAFRRHRTLGYEIAEVVADPTAAPGRATAIGAQEVIVATPDLGRAEFLKLIESLRAVTENVLIVPDLAEVPVLGVEVLGLLEDRALLLRVPNNLLKPWNLLVKRAFDLVVGGLLAALLVPVLALAVVAIALDSPGPLLHIEPRVGRRGTFFKCYKLRTMYRDGDQRLDAYLAAHPDAAAEWERYRKLRTYDPRVTRVGRILRRYSLDEIPQLFNVIRGQMSLVGPRPYLPREMPLVSAEAMIDVLPGITGLWQVSGKNALDLRERARLDRWHVNNWSLWLDVIILVKTTAVVWRAR